MACKAKFLQAVAAVVVVTLVAGKQKDNGLMPSSNRAPGGNPQTHGGSGQYTSPIVRDAATGSDAADGPKSNSYRDSFASPRSEGILVEVPNSEASRQLGDERERNHVGSLKNKKPVSNNVTGAEIIPSTAVREKGLTTDASTHTHGKFSSIDSVGAEVIPSSVTQEKRTTAEGERMTGPPSHKQEKNVSIDVIGSEIIPGAKGKEITPAISQRDEKNSSTEVVGAEVIPRNISERSKNFKVHKANGGLPPRHDIVGSEVIPERASKSNKTTPIKALQPAPAFSVKASGHSEVIGNEVIPSGASKSYITTPLRAHKPERSKHNAPKAANYEQITQSKGPGRSEITSVKGLRSQRSTTFTVSEPLRSPSLKAPRETKPPAVTSTKGRLRPCKEGLNKDLCSFQFHPGGRRHLITPEVLQRYLETGWAPVTTPTKETMHVCCKGKTQMIDFVGRGAKKGDAAHVTRPNKEKMYEEIVKMKRKLRKIQRENEQ